jgi:hypothetical protein
MIKKGTTDMLSGRICGAIAICIPLLVAPARAEVYHLYYLGGQSNMDGYGQVSELPEDFTGPVEDVMIFHGNTGEDAQPADGRGVWSELQPGHGVRFQSDGKQNIYSDRFGVELTLGRRLKELHGDGRIAFIKYSKGGTSIHIDAAGQFGCWDPDFAGGEGSGQGVNQYDHFLATIRNATAVQDIDGDGEPDTLVPTGIVWMQGESDASYTREIAERYQANLKRLVDLIRAALRVDDLPVVIGRISDSGQDADGKVWDHGEIVRQAQADFVEEDAAAALITTTDRYGYSDKWHYDSEGYLDLGRQFADALGPLIAIQP